MSRFSTICRCCLSNGVPRRSLVIAAVVGTILNLINQGDALFGEHPLKLTKLLLTYLVPYCVATYGALSYQLAQNRPSKTPPSVARTSKTAPGKSPRLI
jgi:hypothetical protein